MACGKRIYKHLFGPVPSRRLGISLGIDLIPHKTCSYNCIYCECGKTTNLTSERREYVPTAEVIEELDSYLSESPRLDYITYSGSGEPTLHSGIEKITRFIKDNYPGYRVALLTNGSLFFDKGVRDEMKDIDVIIPSLDAATDIGFMKIDRPCSSLKVEEIISGLVELKKEFSGEFWLEIFVVPGLNDTEEELAALSKAVHRIAPDRVQLNTLDRPGVVDWIRAATQEELEKFAEGLGYERTEITGRPSSRSGVESFSGDAMECIIQTISRRPCTVEDLSSILGMHPNEINKYIQLLIEEGRVAEKREERGIFFVSVE
ncbi:Radical SAM domain protein [Methanolacinia petrolearia DSM 11571]|uniref:Radical SAM domain protein n=1 Tax=Methanolacinia petrolearia (strain DSM 11571 / OCM 486 / SEBR 4847) TaxID=679926 RepID=E1RK13_METP4|nr:radical SAM protein [Methanolacinia petrolearia]ADN35736.1 Radical SAM domain protein [Methanolacinia petrolearia DSM 11571]